MGRSRGILFVAFSLGATGVLLSLTDNKLTSVHPAYQLFGVALMIGGFGWAAWILAQTRTTTSAGPGQAARAPTTIATRWIAYLHPDRPWVLSIYGALAILGDIVYNLRVEGASQVGTHDIALLLLGGVLLFYPLIPGRLGRERDFALVFAAGLTLFLAVPLIIIRAFSLDPSGSVTFYSSFFLVPPLEFVTNLIGISTHAIGNEITIPHRLGGSPTRLVISASCSGIYSFAIFGSAFLAFVTTEYQRWTGRLVGIALVGIFAAYVANLLRMLIIILIGWGFDVGGGVPGTTGLEYLLWTHANAGWIIFLLWVSLFWLALYRFFPPTAQTEVGRVTIGHRPTEAICSLCGGPLSPTIAAAHCACGGIHHLTCLAATDCPIRAGTETG